MFRSREKEVSNKELQPPTVGDKGGITSTDLKITVDYRVGLFDWLPELFCLYTCNLKFKTCTVLIQVKLKLVNSYT